MTDCLCRSGTRPGALRAAEHSLAKVDTALLGFLRGRAADAARRTSRPASFELMAGVAGPGIYFLRRGHTPAGARRCA